MLETYQLEQLIAFAEYKTLSRAAEVLHISQPSLSRTMQQIESEFQVSLFERPVSYTHLDVYKRQLYTWYYERST